MGLISEDYKFGKKAEIAVKPLLDEVFGPLLETDRVNKFHSFDFTNNNYYVEHKQRNCKYGQYPSLYFDYSKYEAYIKFKAIHPHIKFFIIWSCKNGHYYWQFNENENESYISRQTLNRTTHLQSNHMLNIKNEFIFKLDNIKI